MSEDIFIVPLDFKLVSEFWSRLEIQIQNDYATNSSQNKSLTNQDLKAEKELSSQKKES
jgi:hypothetical protein